GRRALFARDPGSAAAAGLARLGPDDPGHGHQRAVPAQGASGRVRRMVFPSIAAWVAGTVLHAPAGWPIRDSAGGKRLRDLHAHESRAAALPGTPERRRLDGCNTVPQCADLLHAAAGMQAGGESAWRLG